MAKLQYRDTNYLVTNDGRVFNNATGKELKPQLRHGYLYVDIKVCGKFKHINIHKMVAELYVHNPLNLPIVNHKDADKTNNNDWNLEWTTHLGNVRHAMRNGLLNNTNGSLAGSKKCRKPVIQMDNDCNDIHRFESVSDARRILGVHVGRVCQCCNGQRNSVGGYKWRWGDDIAKVE